MKSASSRLLFARVSTRKDAVLDLHEAVLEQGSPRVPVTALLQAQASARESLPEQEWASIRTWARALVPAAALQPSVTGEPPPQD